MSKVVLVEHQRRYEDILDMLDRELQTSFEMSFKSLQSSHEGGHLHDCLKALVMQNPKRSLKQSGRGVSKKA